MTSLTERRPRRLHSSAFPISRRGFLQSFPLLSGLLVASPGHQTLTNTLGRALAQDVPPPRFWFGDKVEYSFWMEDETDRRYEIEVKCLAIVTGSCYHRDLWCGNVVTGWWYALYFLEGEGFLSLPDWDGNDLYFEQLLTPGQRD